MASPIFRYPLDPTGVNPDNHVVREPQKLTPKADASHVRVCTPLYGPFYADSVVILDAVTAKPLVKGLDYIVTDLLQDPTLEFGKAIGQFIVIINGLVSNEIEISYQVLGGNYQNNSTAVQHVYETFLNDTRPVDWSNVGNRPATYAPSLHIHLLRDIVNFGPLVVAIDKLRDAKLLNNTPMFEALIQWVKAQKISWDDITNRPTTAEGFGITDAVTIHGTQTINGHKTFNSIHINRNNTAVSHDADDISPVATVAHLGRSIDRVVPNTRHITTLASGGLQGGGSLAGDLSIGLSDTGVQAGVYGSADTVPSFTIDEKGRVHTADHVPIQIRFSGLLGLPTVASGYNLTDVVTTHSNQNITGLKVFDSVTLGNTSVVGNIHNTGYSSIVTRDYLTYIGHIDRVSDQDIVGTKSFKKVILGKESVSANIHDAGYSSIATLDYINSLGLVDSVTDQSISGVKEFDKAYLKSTSLAQAPDTGAMEPLATSGYVARLSNTAVPLTRSIHTTEDSGLIGGGSLIEDLTLRLGLSGVDAGDYGSVSAVPSITVDSFGRIMTASTKRLRFDSLTDIPTTVAGYGITDAVDLHSTQVVAGHKSFNKLSAGKDSTGINIHDLQESPLVADGYMKHFIDGLLGGIKTDIKNGVLVPENQGSTDGISFEEHGGIKVVRFGNLVLQYGFYRFSGSIPTANIYIPLPIKYYGFARMVTPVAVTFTSNNGSDTGPDFHVSASTLTPIPAEVIHSVGFPSDMNGSTSWAYNGLGFVGTPRMYIHAPFFWAVIGNSINQYR